MGESLTAPRVLAIVQAQLGSLPSDCGHVTLYIRTRKNGFGLRNLEHLGADVPGHRWTVDESRDLEFVRAIAERLEGKPYQEAFRRS